MNNLNNKGFVLAETMIVSVFILSIFSIIFINFYPLMGQYEKREFYDDIDSKYDIYWFKRMFESEKMVSDSKIVELEGDAMENSGYLEIKCDDIFGEYANICEKYKNITNLKKLYFTSYFLDKSTDLTANDFLADNFHMKDSYVLETLYDEDLIDYITYLPKYNYRSPNSAQYRIIAMFEREYDSGKKYKSFATIEVKR